MSHSSKTAGPGFSEVFYQSAVQGIKNAIGEGPMKATVYLLKFTESNANPVEFSTGLRRVFGSGASILEKVVVKELYYKLGLQYQESSDFGFATYLKRAEDAFTLGVGGKNE